MLSEIIQRINNLYGIELGQDDKISIDRVYQKVSSNNEMNKVMNGNNTDDVKLDFFRDLFKSEMVDYYGDRMDFYRKVMDKKIFPMVVESLFKMFSNQQR